MYATKLHLFPEFVLLKILSDGRKPADPLYKAAVPRVARETGQPPTDAYRRPFGKG